MKNRLQLEIQNYIDYGIQYYPIFTLDSNELIGCCGLRKHGDHGYEIGFHIRPCFWKKGYGKEAANKQSY